MKYLYPNAQIRKETLRPFKMSILRVGVSWVSKKKEYLILSTSKNNPMASNVSMITRNLFSIFGKTAEVCITGAMHEIRFCSLTNNNDNDTNLIPHLVSTVPQLSTPQGYYLCEK